MLHVRQSTRCVQGGKDLINVEEVVSIKPKSRKGNIPSPEVRPVPLFRALHPADLEHVWVRPATGLRDRICPVREADGGLQAIFEKNILLLATDMIIAPSLGND